MKELLEYSWQKGKALWKLSVSIYLIQFCCILLLGLSYKHILEHGLVHSLSLQSLKEQYDHTTISEFLSQQSAGISNLIAQLKYVIVIWLLLSVLLHGMQIWAATKEHKTTIKECFLEAGSFYISFFKMALVFLALSFLWTFLVLGIPIINLRPLIFAFSSEKYAIFILGVLILLWIIGLLFIFSWSVFSRLHKIEFNESIVSSLKNGGQFMLSEFSNTLKIIVLYILIHFLLLALYLTIDSYWQLSSWIGILLLFLVQQFFVFIRIHVRQMLYSAYVKIVSN